MSRTSRPRALSLARACSVAVAAAVIAACGGDGGSDPIVPSALQKTAGDNAAGAAGAAASDTPTVKVVDGRGRAARGVVVHFAVSGGGSVLAAVDTTDAQGIATAGTWTLGTTAGSQMVTATSPSVEGVAAVFTAQVNAGPPSRLAFVEEPPATLEAGTPFTVVVEVRDQYGNRVTATPTVSLAFAGTGAATLQNATPVAAANGRAMFPGLVTTRSGTGLQLRATTNGLAPTTSRAFTVTPGAATQLVKISGDVQLGGAGAAAFLPIALRVADQYGNGIAGSPVTFTVTSGGGSLASTSAAADADGVARPGAWTLGPSAGTNSVRATAGTLTLDFTATADAASPHHVVLRYVNLPTRVQQEAFERAWLRWRRLLRSEAQDVALTNFVVNPGCYNTTLNETIDDLLIFVNLSPIDGAGKVLGSAGPCYARPNAVSGRPAQSVIGVMTFDTADLDGLVNAGQLDNVVLHEMGHVIGIGTLWGSSGLSVGANSDTTNYVGTRARAEYQTLGAAAGSTIPLENCVGINGCGAGTRDGHWRESTFNNELMTGYLNNGLNPISRMTVAALDDMGYEIEMSLADAYTLPAGTSAVMAGGAHAHGAAVRGLAIALHERPLDFEPRVLDRRGRPLGTLSEYMRRHPEILQGRPLRQQPQ